MNLYIGQKLLKQKEFGEALNIFLNLEKIEKKDPRIYFYLGLIYFELNNFKKSINYYNKFLEKEPNSKSALTNLAIVYQSIGKQEKAKNIYLKLIQIDKNKINPYYGLFILSPEYITDEHFKNLLKIKDKIKLNLYETGILNFILSKKEKKIQNIKKEIDYLKKFHSDIFISNNQYNVTSQFYYKKIISQYFDKIKILKDNKSKIEFDQTNPIFVVGLPRSGSTLVESILTSSNEKIKSFGECHVFNMSIINQIGPKIYSDNFNIDTFEFLINEKKLKEKVMNKYFLYNNNEGLVNNYFLDKSLENFFNLEIIYSIFPRAKILHTFRNLKDAAISIYQSMLPELSWAHSFDDILNYIDNYLKVISYYKSKYPGLILDIDLEKFTKNEVEISKEFYKFCNLNWNENILNYYKREDLFTKTLSSSQIRSKVSIYEDNKYESYYFLLEKYKDRYEWLNA